MPPHQFVVGSEQAAIQQRKKEEEFKKALPEMVKYANSVVAEMKQYEEKLMSGLA